MDEFKYSGTNITSLRLVDPKHPDIVKFVESWKYEELKFGKTLPPDVAVITVRNTQLLTKYVMMYS